jgi:pantoate--beta-alanine ligase
LQLLHSVGAPEVFVPSVEEMYPAGFDASVHIGGVSQPFEGTSRPTHFDGVAIVVLKLFLATQADVAFFGQKDYQQVCVIRKMVADLNIPIDLAMCPIVREPDGLAMSSRNRYLSPKERQQAVILSRCLKRAEQMIKQDGVRQAATICQTMTEMIQSSGDWNIDYIAIADPATLRELDTIESSAVILLAAKLGTTRLIDNTLVER